MKSQFTSRIGLIAATVGAAVGLGNIWRFPAEVQESGGGAFLLVYILCVFLLGIPVMLTEFSLGRAGGTDAVGAFHNVGAHRGWGVIGGIGILASFIVMGYYMVVSGWTLEYLWQSITGGLFDNVARGEDIKQSFDVKMKEYITTPWPPLICTYAVITMTVAIISIGVQKGIERLSNVLMPLLFVILLVFVVVAATMPGAVEGYKFFLKPDFSKLSFKVIISALGQSFFSLSLGFGVLITYAAYFPRSTRLMRTSVTIAMLDLLVAVMMGLIIFPVTMSFGLEGEGLQGTTLVFVTLPEVFLNMPMSQFWAIMFFTLLVVAALTSCISTAECVVAFVHDRFKVSRTLATIITMLPIYALATLCSLSQGPLDYIHIFGKNIFDFLDNLFTNILLPTSAICLCVWMGWFAPKHLLEDELTNEGSLRAPAYPVIKFIIKYIAPVLILLVFLGGTVF